MICKKCGLEIQEESADMARRSVLHNKLDDKISKFKADVDAALSVSNAITTIEIEYF